MKNLTQGWHIGSQTPVDDRLIFTDLNALKNLGVDNQEAFRYYNGLIVYVISTNTQYIWREVNFAEPQGILDFDFLYPDNIIVNNVDYSKKVYNFFPITTPSSINKLEDKGFWDASTGLYPDCVCDKILITCRLFGQVEDIIFQVENNGQIYGKFFYDFVLNLTESLNLSTNLSNEWILTLNGTDVIFKLAADTPCPFGTYVIETSSIFEYFSVAPLTNACPIKGAVYTVSVSGTLDGINVKPGDVLRALENEPGQNSTKWNIEINQTTFVHQHYIGKSYGGGVIFHLWFDDSGVEHGLIVGLNDLSSNQVWSNINGTSIGSTARSVWDGLSNSNAIVSQASHTNSAAKLCLDSTANSQTDWYLPSIDEMSLLWQNRFQLNKTLSSIGGAAQILYDYWSSSEFGGTTAWNFSTSAGNVNAVAKSGTAWVRAIRKF